MVEVDPNTRKPMKLTQKMRNQCIENENKVYPIKMKQRFINLKHRLSNDIKLLKEYENYPLEIFSYKYQLRWTDEDTNKHINQSTYTKMIQDTLFQYFNKLRDDKMVIFSMSLVYMKEMKKSKSDYCTIRFVKEVTVNGPDQNKDIGTGSQIIGFIECDGENALDLL